MCNHKYKVLDSDIDKLYTDGGLYKTNIHVIFFCETCLDIKEKRKVIEGDVSV